MASRYIFAAVNALDEVRTTECIYYLKATRLNVDGGMRFAFPPYVGKPRLQIGRVGNGL